MAVRLPGTGRVPAALLTLSLATALAGCSSVSDPAGPTTPARASPLADISVTLMQYTHDEVNRVLVVKVHNTSEDESVSLDSVEVLAPGFDGAGRLDLTATLAPGRTLDLRLPYGEPSCAATTDEPVVVRFGLPDSSETVERVSPDGSELLARIREQECSAARIQEAAPTRWDDDAWRRDGSGESAVVHGVLRVGPVASDRPLRIVGVEDTVVFRATASRLPFTLVDGQELALNVTFEAARCDPHVLADAAQGFVFEVRVRAPGAPADGSEDVLLPVVPDAAAKNVLTDGWLEQCGFAGRSG